MPTVSIPPPYRGPTSGAAQVEAAGSSVRECLEDVGARFPGFGDQVFDAEGNVHRFVTLFVNGEEIGRDEIDRAVAGDDRVEVMAALAGGR